MRRWRAPSGLALAVAAGVALVLAGMAPPAMAQDRDALLARVAEHTERAGDRTASAGARAEALSRAIGARALLLERHDDAPEAPVWMLDQAADLLASLALTTADARVLLGLPLPSERARAGAAATRASGLARRAGEAISRRFERQRATLADGGDIDQADRALNRRLADVELGVRRPLLLARALVVAAAAADDASAAGDGLGEAVALLEPVRVAPGAASALRDVTLAHALAAAAAADEDDDGDDRARAVLDGLLASPPPGADGAILAEAALLRARLSSPAPADAMLRAADEAPFVTPEGLRDPWLGLLAIEAAARTLADRGRVDRAYELLTSIERRRDLGATADSRSALADERLVALPVDDLAWAQAGAPTALRVARAMLAARSPALDRRAERLLGLLVDRLEDESADGAGQPEQLARARGLLARVLLANAADGPTDGPRAARALGLVAAMIESAGTTSADDRSEPPPPELDGLLSPAATRALDRSIAIERPARMLVLASALRAHPAHGEAQRWRLGLASLVLEGDRDAAALDRALALAEGVLDTGGAAAGADEQLAAAAAEIAAAIYQHKLAALDSTAGSARARADLLEALLALGLRRADAVADLRAIALELAAVLLELGGRSRAERALSALVHAGDGTEATLLRARALDALARRADAFAAYRRVADALGEPATAQEAGQRFWSVWTRLLELLAIERRERAREDAAEGDRLGSRIRGHLLRLRSIDPALGGEPYATRLREVGRGL